jgi:hypothetical protein
MTEPTPYAAPAAGVKTNTLAIIALIAAFLVPPAGIVCGHLALGQIKKSGEAGHGLAVAGTVLGYIFTALWALAILSSIIVPLLLMGVASQYSVPGY